MSIQSKIGHGTKVTVELPLSEATYIPTHLYDPISLLQTRCTMKTVALSGFDFELSIALKGSLQCYVTKWYQMTLIEGIALADFVIVNERIPDEIFEILAGRSTTPRVLVACSTNSKDVPCPIGKLHKIHMHRISKPVGPNQLAKVMLACLDEGNIDLIGSPSPDLSNRTSPIQENSLSTEEPRDSSSSSGLPASTATEFKPAIILTDVDKENVPVANTEHSQLQIDLPIHGSRPDDIASMRTPSFEKQLDDMALMQRQSRPRILCVDDNAINLRVLQAYLKKLKYTNITCAVDGLEALKAVESSSAEPFDIIFMGKSLPPPPPQRNIATLADYIYVRSKHAPMRWLRKHAAYPQV